VGEKLQQLTTQLQQISDVNNAMAVMGWDQEVMMPEGGTKARARQLSTLARIGHEMATSEDLGDLIHAAAQEIDGAGYDSDEAALLRVAQYDYDQNMKLPVDFVAKFAQLTSEAQSIWAKARHNNDFKAFEPTLEKIFEMTRQGADFLGYTDHPYDALLNQYERGMTTAEVARIFNAHKPALIEMIAAIGEVENRVSDDVLHRDYDIDKQREFGLSVIEKLGFDFTRGRQDISTHPFCTNFSRDDVRITTRFYKDFINPALFGMIHEAGHGMYEQGVAEALDGTPLGHGTSLGVHESQSRMWENVVGRSKGFWSWAYPQLQAQFPGVLEDTDVDSFYKSINTVKRQFIRVEADELTYNLHIMLRFELECDLMTGAIKISDLPQVWNDRFEQFFGIRPPTDTLGVLQDVHWSIGLIGYFPTYALGNLLSMQYYNTAVAANPSLPAEIASGKFDTLLTWLQTNIHQHGRKYTSAELTQRVTGGQIDPAPYVAYLQNKFTDVYGLG